MNFSQWFYESLLDNVARSYDRYGFDSSLSFKHIMDFVTKYLKNNPDAKVLDFGAGKKPFLAKHFKKMGFAIDAHELAQNNNKEHDDVAGEKYDLVVASNVLNVQQTLSNLRKTLNQIFKFTTDNGMLFATVPDQPNENLFTIAKLKDEMLKKFAKVVCIKIKTGTLMQAYKTHD